MNNLWDSLFRPSDEYVQPSDKKIKFHSARAKQEIQIIKRIIGSAGFTDGEPEGRVCWFGDHVFDRILVEDNYDGFFEIVTISVVFPLEEIRLLTSKIIGKVCSGWTERNLLTLQGGSFSQVIASAFGLKSYAQGKLAIQNIPSVVFSVQSKLDRVFELRVADTVGADGTDDLYTQIEKYLNTVEDGDIEDGGADRGSPRSSNYKKVKSPRLRSQSRSPSRSPEYSDERNASPSMRTSNIPRRTELKRCPMGPRSPQCVPVSSTNPFKVTETEGSTNIVSVKTIVGKK